MEPFELLAHPVRLRIVHALRGGHTRTTAELGRRLSDVSKAMLYRHIELLAEAGVLEVAEERRVRGAVERHYRLRQDRAILPTEAVPPTEHRQVFATALAILAAEFDGYLSTENADPATDLVGLRQHALWLDRAELESLFADLRTVLLPRLANPRTPERTQYLLSPIIFPIEAAESD
ncbi:ArsR family transcriptional regulator [Nocardia panacis]|uniref:ArsR family transcriptional regulator n=1 Tax=Nocardia panacis TaxID=2340916 RepID=A0A3A4KGD4_9NOCA|nr:helix-turn-helix domain-containing protein [Nocardia panacis]RJO78374.1 ArsR family transcriptional regulator [Nocardia panacis]